MQTQSQISEIKVIYQSAIKKSLLPVIKTSKDAYLIFKEIWSSNIEFKEEFYILLLNRANKVLGWYKVSEGGVAGTLVDPKIIFSVALKCNASAVVLAHNHPSGSLKPSLQDNQLTQKLKEGGKILEISVLDHLIMTSESYFSFEDEGIF